MKKSNLKDEMVVKIEGYSNEEYDGLMLVLGEFFFDINGYEKKTNFDENMINIDLKKVKITEVYEVIEPFSLKEILNEGKGLRLIWKRQKEIDWSKVPKWTKVQIKYCEDGRWRNRYFIRYNPYKKDHFIVSILDEFLFEESSQDFSPTSSYEQCRIHPSVSIPEEWCK